MMTQIASSFPGYGQSSRVDLSHCLYRDSDDPASSYIIRSEATGSRTLVNYNELPEMTVEEFVLVARAFEALGEETWWHFEVRVGRFHLYLSSSFLS
jgi:ketohexokinase